MPCALDLPGGTLIRTERSLSVYSRGAELAQTIHNLSKGERHPACDWICQEFDLTTFEWHYWRKIAEAPKNTV